MVIESRKKEADKCRKESGLVALRMLQFAVLVVNQSYKGAPPARKF